MHWLMTDLSSIGGGAITPPERVRSCVVMFDWLVGEAVGGLLGVPCWLARSRT